MMKSGKCPKCGSTEVYVDTMKTKQSRGARDEMSITGLVSVQMTNYVCVECGFTESYIVDELARLRISKKWHHVEYRPESKHDETIKHIEKIERNTVDE